MAGRGAQRLSATKPQASRLSKTTSAPSKSRNTPRPDPPVAGGMSPDSGWAAIGVTDGLEDGDDEVGLGGCSGLGDAGPVDVGEPGPP